MQASLVIQAKNFLLPEKFQVPKARIPSWTPVVVRMQGGKP